MIGYIGYIRVSTAKQGTKGVSLQEQRDAISRYAERNHLTITLWLEEIETAAKRGRAIFNQMLSLLRVRKARGVILHKLDRGARNLKDWADVGELVDVGVEVHFANDNLDLQTRGGRLSADIQAVVAADYIRNLREETRKGFYGRLKQGLYPMRAPIGYLDQGKGKPKTVDPIQGPLVLRTYELYGSGRYSLDSLGEELFRLGLRNKNGGRVTRNGLSILLHNPFYVGIMRIIKTGESFEGIHQPLIPKSLFDRVQAVLSGKIFRRTTVHEFAFRRLITCGQCDYSLIGERQKGLVYYRCHSKSCRGTSIRESEVEAEMEKLLNRIQFNDQERAFFRANLPDFRKEWAKRNEATISTSKLRAGQIKERLHRLTDAYIDGALDRASFEERKASLLHEQSNAQEALVSLSNDANLMQLEKNLELAETALLSYQLANCDERRNMVKLFTSNRQVTGKKLCFEPSIPFREIANRTKNEECDPQPTTPRTLKGLLDSLTELSKRGEFPGFKDLRGGQLN
jgi:DNA invertase Pin-like site-specific DNA recombinase